MDSKVLFGNIEAPAVFFIASISCFVVLSVLFVVTVFDSNDDDT